MIPLAAPLPFPQLGFSIERADKARVWRAVQCDPQAVEFLRSFGAQFGELAVRDFTLDGESIA